MLIAPAIGEYIPLQHLKEQAGTSTRAMLFFTGDHVAGAHGAAIHAAALPHADAAQGSSGETSFIIRKCEVCSGLSRVVGGAEAQVFVKAIRVDNLTWIHLPIWIPDSLELAKCLHEFRTIHFGEQFRTCLAISMFS